RDRQGQPLRRAGGHGGHIRPEPAGSPAARVRDVRPGGRRPHPGDRGDGNAAPVLRRRLRRRGRLRRDALIAGGPGWSVRPGGLRTVEELFDLSRLPYLEALPGTGGVVSLVTRPIFVR